MFFCTAFGTGLLPQNPPLFTDDLLHERDLLFGSPVRHHRLIPVAAHAKGNNLLVILGQLNSFSPKLIKNLRIVPSVSAPLAPTPHHRLVVGGADHNPVLIRQFRVVEIIPEKTLWTPHRRP